VTEARSLWRISASLGLRSLPVPAMAYIPLGYLLGSQYLNMLSSTVLEHLHVVIWLALATLGVFVGLALDLRTAVQRRLLAAASVQALVTGVIVAGVTAAFMAFWGIALGNPIAPVPIALGICAAASAALLRREPSRDESLMVQIADLDDVIVIAVAGVLLVSHRVPSFASLAQAGVITVTVGMLIGMVGWLLFEGATSDAERGVFVLGAVVLAGGTAAYVGLSPLLLGMVTGIVWRWTPGHADRIVRSALDTIQHPLLVLLLVLAGAMLKVTLTAVWLLVIVVICRLAGKILGSWTGARVLGGMAPAHLGARLMPCGVLGVGTAIHVQSLAGDPVGGVVLSVTALSTVIFEIIAIAVLAQDGRPA
jgi:hypothetical protein